MDTTSTSNTTSRTLGPANDAGVLPEEWAKARETAHLAAKNLAFAKLSPAKKRVAIARDVLKALRLQKLIPSTGTYVFQVAPGDNGQSLDGGKCTVCALGGLFACATDRGVGSLRTVLGNNSFLAAPIRATLGQFFSWEQLGYIEAAFEMRAGWAAVEGTDPYALLPRAYEAAEWCTGWAAEERMVAIMRNIIRNGGTFNLDDPPTRGSR